MNTRHCGLSAVWRSHQAARAAATSGRFLFGGVLGSAWTSSGERFHPPRQRCISLTTKLTLTSNLAAVARRDARSRPRDALAQIHRIRSCHPSLASSTQRSVNLQDQTVFDVGTTEMPWRDVLARAFSARDFRETECRKWASEAAFCLHPSCTARSGPIGRANVLTSCRKPLAKRAKASPDIRLIREIPGQQPRAARRSRRGGALHRAQTTGWGGQDCPADRSAHCQMS